MKCVMKAQIKKNQFEFTLKGLAPSEKNPFVLSPSINIFTARTVKVYCAFRLAWDEKITLQKQFLECKINKC